MANDVEIRDLTEGMSAELKVILFVALEHFLLLLAWVIHKGIPDRPSSVRIALARTDYESKQALKREVCGNETNLIAFFPCVFFVTNFVISLDWLQIPQARF